MVSVLGPRSIGLDSADSCDVHNGISFGQKRPSHDDDHMMHKRLKRDDSKDMHDDADGLRILAHDQNIESADDMRRLIISFIDVLRPGCLRGVHVKPEIAIMALSKLSLVFCSYQPTGLSNTVFRLAFSWVHWIYSEVCQKII